jgi:outer membrane biosynthesis protein TonB
MPALARRNRASWSCPTFPFRGIGYDSAMKRVCWSALALLALLSACAKPDNAAGPGGVTVGEAKALDEAAEMLDSRRIPAPPPPAPQPQAAPAASAKPDG